MALFPLSGVLRGFSPRRTLSTPQAETLVRPSSAKKLLISYFYLVKDILFFIFGVKLEA